MERSELKRAFIARTDWADARIELLAGDASMRKYDRLTRPDGSSAVLMDAPTDKGEDVRPFLRIAEFLLATGLSAPRILAQDTTQGFLLIEDLGDAIYARVMETSPELEIPLYEAATDALVQLHRGTVPPRLKTYDAEVMTDLAALAYDWYQQGITGAAPRGINVFRSTLRPLLQSGVMPLDVVILRDYHAENLLWLPDRSGVARVGQLDFQDAMIGHRAYDLVSLLQDARRDVLPAIEEVMIRRFVETSGLDPEALRHAYDLLGIQRNLRIIGVFARLSLVYGKPHYVDLLPRVWGYLMRCLDRPGMEDLRDILMSDLPWPTPENLEILKDKCATCQLP